MTKRHPKSRCKRTGSIKRTEMAAIAAAIRLSKKRGKPLRYFQCGSCGMYHLARARSDGGKE